MASNVSSPSKNEDVSEDFLSEDIDAEGLEVEADLPPRVSRKDPDVRRKIEDMLERRRLREELGLYDEAYWDDI